MQDSIIIQASLGTQLEANLIGKQLITRKAFLCYGPFGKVFYYELNSLAWELLNDNNTLRHLFISTREHPKDYLDKANVRVDDLSEREQALLRSVPKTGDIQVITTDQTGQWIRTGDIDFLDSNDARVAANGIHALQLLREKGLVRHVEGILYRLTVEGWNVKKDIH